MLPTVTFETKVWEGDYEIILGTNRLQKMIDRNCHAFERRLIYINNVNDYAKVSDLCRKKVDEGIIDDFVVVKDHAEEALDFFGLTQEDFGKGYVYSIAELVSIYLCKTEYLLHFAGDSCLAKPYHWMGDTLALMAKSPEIKVATLVWNSRLDQVRRESFREDETFCHCYGFSDQMYLVRAADFRQRIYEESHPFSDRYPKYGGELFEKRVDSWMRNHDYRRVVWKHGYYRHVSFKTDVLGRLRGYAREWLN
ncbi:MAG: hypothetical protein Q8J78_05855 [Moraxellaceae bacterium]|nr:hypothetical protein [Moraxellaceae bacterium]